MRVAYAVAVLHMQRFEPPPQRQNSRALIDMRDVRVACVPARAEERRVQRVDERDVTLEYGGQLVRLERVLQRDFDVQPRGGLAQFHKERPIALEEPRRVVGFSGVKHHARDLQQRRGLQLPDGHGEFGGNVSVQIDAL